MAPLNGYYCCCWDVTVYDVAWDFECVEKGLQEAILLEV